MNRPFRLGLTGSIGMGKSTTAKMFSEEGVPVWDADAAVHRLYESGGKGVDAIRLLCKDCVVEGAVDRSELKAWLSGNEDRFKSLEAAIHPLVSEDRAKFLANSNEDIVLLDIPLLYETNAEAEMDAVVVVTVPFAEQRARVLARDGFTEAMFLQILDRQVPDAEKRERADYVITTSTLEAARRQVQDVIASVREKLNA